MNLRAIAPVLFLACVALTGCIQKFVTGHYFVSATIDQWQRGYYATANTIRRIRGTLIPVGPVRLAVTLPDGEHSIEFDLMQ